jgi:hypothetical protein
VNGALGTDSFGNTLLSGSIREAHRHFVIDTAGEIAFTGDYVIPDAEPNPLYRYPSRFTVPDSKIRILFTAAANCTGGDGDTSAKCKGDPGATVAKCTAVVHEALLYTPGATGIYTTAAEALALGKGVCQDYAHLLIALLRLAKIPARYVAGLTPGEGQTHAWVEWHDGTAWKAVDPTRNRDYPDCAGYIKLSHGRDYEDCSVERGVFTGVATQLLNANVSVILD